MGKVEITYYDELREKAIDALKRTSGSDIDEIRKKMANLSDQDKKCIIKYFDIDAEDLELLVTIFWFVMAKPVVEVFPGISSEIFNNGCEKK